MPNVYDEDGLVWGPAVEVQKSRWIKRTHMEVEQIGLD